MEIMISYFSSPAPAGRKVCIAKKCPAGFKGLQVIELAPSNPWAKGDWRARYRAELDERFPNPEALRNLLVLVHDTVPDPILCCYEKRPEDCHRGELAKWAREKLGVDIPEWQLQRSLI